MSVTAIVRLLRPEQWVKNVFVMIPAFFAGIITDYCVLSHVVLASVLFCMMASAVYCINDVADSEADRSHPVKCHRPVASGVVSRRSALTVSVVLAVVVLSSAYRSFGIPMAIVFACYLSLNFCYTLWLKRIALVDVSVIALGFVLRLLAGGYAASCQLSSWIVVVTFMLSLFLAFGKRREDGDVVDGCATGQRPVYTRQFLDMAMAVCATVVIAAYFIYTIIPSSTRTLQSQYFYLTGVPVAIGLLRYILVCVSTNKGAAHSLLIFRDVVIRWCIVVYLLLYLYFALYG